MTWSECLARVAVVAGLVSSMTIFSPLAANAASSWQYAQPGEGKAAASLFSSNAITTGSRAIDFYPVLTLSCDVSRPGIWRQAVRIREPISSGSSARVQVRFDQGAQERQVWSLGQKNRALMLDGAAPMARLVGKSRVRIAWSEGFFSGDGEAVFDLRLAGDVIAKLAETCGVVPPSR